MVYMASHYKKVVKKMSPHKGDQIKKILIFNILIDKRKQSYFPSFFETFFQNSTFIKLFEQ